MANPNKENASAFASSEKNYSTRADAPSQEDGASESSAAQTQGMGSDEQKSNATADASTVNGVDADAGVCDEDNVTNATTTEDDLVDAVLEAEAAAIVDDAMDEERSDAQAAVASKELAEWKDKYMRLHAEWDTYRRRQKEQAETQKALAAEKLVNSLIPIIDDLERSIDYAQKNGEAGLLSGVEAVLAKFIDTLKKDGVDVIDPAGEAFNALEAQAVGTVDDASQPDETVADVYQKGYKIANKVLRPATVTITTGGPKRETNKED